MIPLWLHWLAIAALAFGAGCALLLALAVWRNPQQMAVMNIVWPVTALFGTVFSVWGYQRYGRLATRHAAEAAKARGEKPPHKERTPFAAMVGKGAAHCGSGCCLGDILAEILALQFPVVALWFGWQSLFAEKVFAVWALDYLLAFVLGIAFQYFSIVPMRHPGVWQGLWRAVKADTLSLTAWQVGMYGFMAIAQFWLFRRVLGLKLEADRPEFWFMMQLAMLFGFVTSYPVNWWLLRAGIKEAM